MVGQLCRGIDRGNGRGAWNVRAKVGGDIGYIATWISVRTILPHVLSKVHVMV